MRVISSTLINKTLNESEIRELIKEFYLDWQAGEGTTVHFFPKLWNGRRVAISEGVSDEMPTLSAILGHTNFVWFDVSSKTNGTTRVTIWTEDYMGLMRWIIISFLTYQSLLKLGIFLLQLFEAYQLGATKTSSMLNFLSQWLSNGIYERSLVKIEIPYLLIGLLAFDIYVCLEFLKTRRKRNQIAEQFAETILDQISS